MTATRMDTPPIRDVLASPSRALLAVHVTTSVGLIGADLALLTLALSGRFGSDPATAYPAMRLVAAAVMAPLGLLALATGLLLAVRSGWGVLRYWWVTIKLAVTTSLTALVLLVVIPGLGRAADAATGVTAESLLTDAQRLLYVVTPSVALTLLLLNVALGVYKPRWRLRGGSPQ